MHRFHPPLIYGRRGDAEVGEGICLCRVFLNNSDSILNTSGKPPWYIAASCPTDASGASKAHLSILLTTPALGVATYSSRPRRQIAW